MEILKTEKSNYIVTLSLSVLDVKKLHAFSFGHYEIQQINDELMEKLKNIVLSWK